MTQQWTYKAVLRKAYYDAIFWRKLIAKPVKTLEDAQISLSTEDEEKLFAALKDFSLVISFDKYRASRQQEQEQEHLLLYFNNPNSIDPGEYDNTGWGCDDIAPKVPWGQT
jgi:hypothetical protein